MWIRKIILDFLMYLLSDGVSVEGVGKISEISMASRIPVSDLVLIYGRENSMSIYRVYDLSESLMYTLACLSVCL